MESDDELTYAHAEQLIKNCKESTNDDYEKYLFDWILDRVWRYEELME